jgi:TolA-binding protein
MAAYEQSLSVRKQIGDRRGEADILLCLGKILVRTGRPDEAREVWTEALATFSDLGAPQASDVAAHLNALPRT